MDGKRESRLSEKERERERAKSRPGSTRAHCTPLQRRRCAFYLTVFYAESSLLLLLSVPSVSPSTPSPSLSLADRHSLSL